MGYIRHHAIVVTSYSDFAIIEARNKASEIFGMNVSELVDSNINRYRTFLVAPDGSKEGWEESNLADDDRAEFVQWIKSKNFDDGSNPISYAELFYGDDEGQAEIVNHN